MIEIIVNAGRTTPRVAHMAPAIPATLLPINVAELIAMGPGVASAIATISSISSSLVQPYLSTASLEMRGSIA